MKALLIIAATLALVFSSPLPFRDCHEAESWVPTSVTADESNVENFVVSACGKADRHFDYVGFNINVMHGPTRVIKYSQPAHTEADEEICFEYSVPAHEVLGSFAPLHLKLQPIVSVKSAVGVNGCVEVEL